MSWNSDLLRIDRTALGVCRRAQDARLSSSLHYGNAPVARRVPRSKPLPFGVDRLLVRNRGDLRVGNRLYLRRALAIRLGIE